ncbi:MAG: hypothetical protein IPM98_03685 [Lewinellaceae bacterium]|nr:hypothetical protein [Lewinellaceae bacterium]
MKKRRFQSRPAGRLFRLFSTTPSTSPKHSTLFFLSDEDGLVRAFRWLPGADTARVSVPDARAGDRFDCTVVRIVPLLAPGSGIRDTTVTMTTYTGLTEGGDIYLREPDFLKTTDLTITFTGVSTLDSIVVPDGLTFALPQADNNFRGEYRVFHTGRFWCRVKVNGEPNWRYLFFDNVTTPTLEITRDASDLSLLADPSATIALPFITTWNYQLDRVMDLSQNQFLALGALIPIPGGPIPVFDALRVFEPPGLPANGYRLRLSGFDAAPGGYGYECDLFFQIPPAALPLPAFDIQPTTLADDRLLGVLNTGPIDLLAFTRTGTPNLTWEVLAAPSTTGLVTYRLPDVPAELANLFPNLGMYNFGGQVRVRAEGYEQLGAYEEVVARRMLQDDPLWQMKAGYTARERIF